MYSDGREVMVVIVRHRVVLESGDVDDSDDYSRHHMPHPSQ